MNEHTGVVKYASTFGDQSASDRLLCSEAIPSSGASGSPQDVSHDHETVKEERRESDMMLYRTGATSTGIPSARKQLIESRVDCIIRRVSPEVTVTPDRDFKEGFLISEAGSTAGQSIRFTEWDAEASAVCETPWGRISLTVDKPHFFEWTVKLSDQSATRVKIQPGSHVEFLFPEGTSLRLKNRSILRDRIYRHRDERGEIVIRTETPGGLPFNPFMRERDKQWRIVISGEWTRARERILPQIATFLCFYKIYRRGDLDFYDTMF